jgi:hypothetical protein
MPKDSNLNNFVIWFIGAMFTISLIGGTFFFRTVSAMAKEAKEIANTKADKPYVDTQIKLQLAPVVTDIEVMKNDVGTMKGMLEVLYKKEMGVDYGKN